MGPIKRSCGLGCHELCIVSWVGGLKGTGIILPPPNRTVISLTGWVLKHGVGILFLLLTQLNQRAC